MGLEVNGEWRVESGEWRVGPANEIVLSPTLSSVASAKEEGLT
jgi:hypothetical protein